MTRRIPFRIKTTGCLLVLFIFCGTLWGCSEREPAAQAIDWPESPYSNSNFAETDIIMEMALEVYGSEDNEIAYILINTGMDPVSFTGEFSLEFNNDGLWLSVPFAAETDLSEIYTLPGMQACKIELPLSFFRDPLPEGLYRIVRNVGRDLKTAGFTIEERRMDIHDMTFGHTPLSSLPADYDGHDAQNDGYYTIIEDGVYNQEAVQIFADRAHLGVPAKLRTVMHTAEGAVLIRDIIFAPGPDSDSPGRFIVVLDDSRRTTDSEQLLTERVYSNLSIAQVGNKRKVCLSNYVSHILDAPPGAPLELISPNAADNIDLVATVELRVEELVSSLPYMFIVYGPDGKSFATTSRGGKTFGYQYGDIAMTDIRPDQSGLTLTVIKWMSGTQFLLYGTMPDGKIYEFTYEIETDASSDM